MRCPACGEASVPFGRVWLRGGTGRFACDRCGAQLRLQRNPWLVLISGALAAGAAAIGYFSLDWGLLLVSFVVVLSMDAALDYHFRRLVQAEPEAAREGGAPEVAARAEDGAPRAQGRPAEGSGAAGAEKERSGD